MGAKAWCCGGGSSGGGGAGLTSVSVADTATVDLEGNGTTAAPVTAVVKRSTDAGNTLTVGSDGALFVPASSGGGLSSVTTADTATVDLSGDGTAGNPVTATVLSVPAGVAPIVANDTPTVDMSGDGTTGNPLTSVVLRSADAGNALTVGSDGALYVPTASSGGLNTVATADTATVDLAGDGTAGNPITATVISVPAGVAPIVTQNSTTVGLVGDGTTASPLIAVAQIAPEPNGLEDSPGGLLVTPSGQAGNRLVMGTDNRLYVAPDPAPVWGQETPVRVIWQTGQPNPPTGSPEAQGTFTAPEDGLYDVDYVVTGSVGANDPVAGFNANITVRTSISDPLNFYVAQTQYADGTEPVISGAGSVTVSRRVQLTAGQVVTGLVQRVETGTSASTNFDVSAYWAWHKID